MADTKLFGQSPIRHQQPSPLPGTPQPGNNTQPQQQHSQQQPKQKASAENKGQASASSSSASGSSQKNVGSSNPLEHTLTRKHIQELTKAVDPNEQLDDDVEEYLLDYAESYLEELIDGACLLAAHRKGNTVDCKDVQTHLERSCNVWIPGFGAEEVRPFKRAPTTEAHKQRMALIKKTVKKY